MYKSMFFFVLLLKHVHENMHPLIVFVARTENCPGQKDVYKILIVLFLLLFHEFNILFIQFNVVHCESFS